MTTGEYTALEVYVGGTSYNISNRTEYIHLGHDGLGMAPVRRFTQAGPLQDGETDLGFRLQPRVINLILNTLSRTRAEYWALREELLYIFTPRTTPINLRLTYKYYDPEHADAVQAPGETGYVKKMRQIDCYLTGGLTLPSDQKQGNFNGHKIALELTAPNPLWYDPTELTITFGDSPYATGPLDDPLPVPNAGTYKTYPVIELHGPLNDFVLTNTSTGDKLDFTGYNIPDFTPNPTTGKVIIDCRYGYKTVLNAAGTSLLPYLSTDSDLATFCMEANPTVTDGENVLTATASNDITTASYVIFKWFNQYTGV